MNMVLRGRLILQGFVLGEFYQDMEKMKKKETNVGKLSIAAWGSLKAGIGTMGIWLPWFKARTIGQAGTWILRTSASITAPVALGYALGATAGTIIAEEAFGEGQMAYDLYTNPRFEEGGILYETADILGNAWTIFTHYRDEGHFSAANREGQSWEEIYGEGSMVGNENIQYW